jgi:nitrite reductase (NADH) small subunit
MKEGKAWVRIARCRDIPLREGRAVKVGHREIAIFNLGDQFLAVDNRCPHKGGPLADGVVAGTAVVCPLHAWKISLATGEGLNSASASHCVETFPTRVEQGIIFLEFRADSGNEDESGAQGPRAQEPTVICVDPGIAPANDSCPAT